RIAALQRSAAPLQRSAAPLQRSAAPLQRSAAPLQRSADPLQCSVAPLEWSAAALQRSIARQLSDVGGGKCPIFAWKLGPAALARLSARPGVSYFTSSRFTFPPHLAILHRMGDTAGGVVAEVRQGDCLDVLAAAGGAAEETFDLIFTSPPYADRRAKTYGGIKPEKYVEWFLPRAE